MQSFLDNVENLSWEMQTQNLKHAVSSFSVWWKSLTFLWTKIGWEIRGSCLRSSNSKCTITSVSHIFDLSNAHEWSGERWSVKMFFAIRNSLHKIIDVWTLPWKTVLCFIPVNDFYTLHVLRWLHFLWTWCRLPHINAHFS